jgi:hypothetical protein
MILRHLLAALLLAATLPALADSTASKAPTVSNMSVQQFLAYHDDVARRAKTKDFEGLSRGERDQLAAAQGEIRQALAGKASMTDLDDPAKLVVFNAHEKVLALVTKAEDERLVCKQQKRIGSNRRTLECRTVAQLREERERAQDSRMRNRTCDPSLGACGARD